jgi:RNA polymerase sigma factor (sigma-70 family)
MVVKPGTVAADGESVASRPDEEFLRSVWPGLVRLGRLLTGSQQRGEDLAQEAILGLLRGAAVRQPRAYLRRSIVNLSITAARRDTRERAYLHTVRDQIVSPPEVDDLWPLIVALPARQRAVLVLRYYEDLSESEIAGVLGCRPGTVKSLASRALDRLRRELES